MNQFPDLPITLQESKIGQTFRIVMKMRPLWTRVLVVADQQTTGILQRFLLCKEGVVGYPYQSDSYQMGVKAVGYLE